MDNVYTRSNDIDNNVNMFNKNDKFIDILTCPIKNCPPVRRTIDVENVFFYFFFDILRTK